MSDYNWERPYHCKKCGQDFETAEQIQRHIKLDHKKKADEQPVRCHRCGTRKHDEDVGVFFPWKAKNGQTEYISWFHNVECQRLWLVTYADKIDPIT